MKIIRYFSYYGCSIPSRKRINSPAADTKVDYIIEVLNRCGYAVEHVSRAGSSKIGYIPGYVEKRGVNTFRYFATWGTSSVLKKILNKIMLSTQFFLWCLFNLKRYEQVIVYHSLGYDLTFLWLKKIKKIRIIGDIEEIYQDVHSFSKKMCENEYRFIAACDKLMYPNTILNERLNPNNRPNLVIHGIYKLGEQYTKGHEDDKIHILYAGTYDPVKGGAIASLKTARYLTENYHLHITGFGTQQQEEEVIKEFESACRESKCTITYHGYLDYKEFTDVMHSCQIGLCTQDPTSKLNFTSFPSKILTYMSNGLVVLTGRNRAIEESAVGDIVYYYDEQLPEVMASAIMAILNPDGEKCKLRLQKLDKSLEQHLKTFIEL